MSSIRAFLLAGVLGSMTAVILTTSVVGYRSARHEIGEIYDANLVQYARLLHALLAGREPAQAATLVRALVLPDLGGADEEAIEDRLAAEPGLIESIGHPYERKFAFQLLDADGGVVLQSPQAPAVPFAALRPGIARAHHGDDTWVVFTTRDGDSANWLQVAERLEVREELIEEIAVLSVTPQLLALPAILLLVYWVVGRGLAPLVKMARAIGRRAPENLRPMQWERLPRELAPLDAAVNRLMLRLDGALERERRFTADAAHELKTPLTVLKVHAHNAVSAPDAATRDKALEHLLQGVDRTAHLVTQLLTLARVEPAPQATATVDLVRLVREEVAALAPLALQRGQELQFASEREHVGTAGDEAALKGLVRNLLDNAIRYTPVDGRIAVSLDWRDARVRLRVSDSGPGIAEDLCERVFERFFRVPGNRDQGAGLGLSIVKRAADHHRAAVSLGRRRDNGDFYVDVSFPGEAQS